MRQNPKPEAFKNNVQSNGTIGQQDIFHFHLHLVPRFESDDILLEWDNTPADRAYLNKLAQEIQANL